MKKEKRLLPLAAILITLGIAYIFRIMGLMNIDIAITRFIRSTMHIIIFSVWCVSLQRRIIQQQTKKYLMYISCLMIFWVILKTLKYFIITRCSYRPLYLVYVLCSAAFYPAFRSFHCIFSRKACGVQTSGPDLFVLYTNCSVFCPCNDQWPASADIPVSRNCCCNVRWKLYIRLVLLADDGLGNFLHSYNACNPVYKMPYSWKN